MACDSLKQVFAFYAFVATVLFSMPKKSNKVGRPPRSGGMTMISISLQQSLVAKIDKMAEAENRNRSNFIANVMEKLASK